MKTENTLRVGFPAHTDVLIDLSLGRERVCVCVFDWHHSIAWTWIEKLNRIA